MSHSHLPTELWYDSLMRIVFWEFTNDSLSELYQMLMVTNTQLITTFLTVDYLDSLFDEHRMTRRL